MARHSAAGFAALLLVLLQVALAVTIPIVVSQVLWTYSGGWRWAPSWWSQTSADNVCLMTTGSVNLCAFTYVVIAVSLAGSVLLFLSQCFPRRCCRCCASLEVWLAALLAAWWAGAATAATVYGTRADRAAPPLPEHDARTAVWAMAWCEVGLWGLSAVVALTGRAAARRRYSDTELSASMAGKLKGGVGASRYQRYDDTPFTDRSSKWKDARDSYLARGTPVAKQLDP